MWQCNCGRGCRTALECLSKDKELESNVKSNVRQSRGFDKKEYQKFYMRRKRLFEAAERLTAERIGVVTFGNCIHYPGGPKRSAQRPKKVFK